MEKLYFSFKSEYEIHSSVERLIAEGKDCEKNLLYAVGLYLFKERPHGTPTVSEMVSMIEDHYKYQFKKENLSNLDLILNPPVDKKDFCKYHHYYRAFKMYPEGMQGQACGNVLYKLIPLMEE